MEAVFTYIPAVGPFADRKLLSHGFGAQKPDLTENIPWSEAKTQMEIGLKDWNDNTERCLVIRWMRAPKSLSSSRRYIPAAVMKQLIKTVAPSSSLSVHSTIWPFTAMQVWSERLLSVPEEVMDVAANQ